MCDVTKRLCDVTPRHVRTRNVGVANARARALQVTCAKSYSSICSTRGGGRAVKAVRELMPSLAMSIRGLRALTRGNLQTLGLEYENY